MKKLFLSVMLCVGMAFTMTAQVEKKLPAKEFPQLYAIASNAP
jgi:hypothetical protein